MCIHISYVNINDLNNFLRYLRSREINVNENYHTVLLDSSEFEIIECNRKNRITYMLVHYIDTHYAVLSDLGESESDENILQVLLLVDKKKLWRIPVEPIIYITNDCEFERIISSYIDEIPDEGKRYLEKYVNSEKSYKNAIDIDMVINIISRFKETGEDI